MEYVVGHEVVRGGFRAFNTGVMARIAEIADEFTRKKDPSALVAGLED